MNTQHNLSDQIVQAIKSVVGAGPVALHEPRFRGNEWLYLKECLDSTFVSSVGKFVDRFEDELAVFTGAKRQPEWVRYLKLAAATRKNLGGVLAVFDGDSGKLEGQPFSAVTAARTLAERGRAAGAGSLFSLAVVFLRQEYESILIAAADQIPDIDPQVPRPANPEDAPRDAKGWLADHLQGGYDPKTNQRTLTQAVQNWQPVRETHRSFRRFDNALRQLAEAVATGVHVVTPTVPAPPTAQPTSD